MFGRIVHLSIGSNMGQKLANCSRTISLLAASAGAKLTAQSRFYQTAPMDSLDQDWFVNAAVEIQTRQDPFQLLLLLQSTQRQMVPGL